MERRLARLEWVRGFSDKQIEAGHRYRYTVTSFDKLNNESVPSAPVDTKS